jgi:Glycosyl hydrolase family 65 central catalytic domain
MWISLGDSGDGRFELNGVTGPDEYSAVADNNVYTNLMAQRNLRLADRLCSVHRDEANALDVATYEREAWRAAADRMAIPYDEARGLHHQAERFLDHGRLNFEALGDEDARRSPLSRSDVISSSTKKSPFATQVSSPGFRQFSPPRWGIWSSPLTISPRRLSSTLKTASTTLAMACIWHRWAAAGWRSSPGSEACASTTEHCDFVPGCLSRCVA